MINQLLTCSLLAALSINRVLAAVHVVNVGNGGFRYDPQVTNASQGDIVTFKFFPTNHSVYRAVYTESPTCPGGYCNPCVPSNIYFPAEKDFFFSTLKLGNITNPPEWNLTINDTQPIFFSCNAPGSCNPNGMVGVINPNSSTSISKQEAAAKSAQYQLSPGDEFPSESAPTAPATSTDATSQPTSSPPSSSSGSSQSNNSGGSSNSSSSHHGLSKGAIAGIAVGSVVAVALFGALIFYYAKSRAYSHIFSASQGKGGEDSGISSSSAPAGGGGGGGGIVGAWLASQQQHQREKLGMDAEAQAQRGGYQPASTGVSSPRPTVPGSPTPEQGAQFVGYNRLSGNEEYAFEAPGLDNQISEMRTPPMRPLSWSRDAKTSSPGPGGRVELP